MARKFLTPLTLPLLESDPELSITGSVYYNTVDNLLKFYNGSSWIALTPSGNSIVDHTHSYDGSINYVGSLQFDSSNSFDAGNPSSIYDSVIDGGSPSSDLFSSVDGGNI
jgi:hypothetical protein